MRMNNDSVYRVVCDDVLKTIRLSGRDKKRLYKSIVAKAIVMHAVYNSAGDYMRDAVADLSLFLVANNSHAYDLKESDMDVKYKHRRFAQLFRYEVKDADLKKCVLDRLLYISLKDHKTDQKDDKKNMKLNPWTYDPFNTRLNYEYAELRALNQSEDLVEEIISTEDVKAAAWWW